MYMIISIQGIPQRKQQTLPACLENYSKQSYTPFSWLGLVIKLWKAYYNEPTLQSDTELSNLRLSIFLLPIKVTSTTRPKVRLLISVIMNILILISITKPNRLMLVTNFLLRIIFQTHCQTLLNLLHNTLHNIW